MPQPEYSTTPFDQPNPTPATPSRRPKRNAAPLLAGAGVLLAGGALAYTLSRRQEAPQPPAAPAALAAKPRPTPKPTPTVPPTPAWAKGAVINDVPVKSGQKVVSLTFDDGPWPDSTQQILDILKSENVKATFFMVGREIARRPELAQRVKAAGHELAGHSYTHSVRFRDPDGEVTKTDKELKRILGFTPTIYRPPYGILKNAVTRKQRAMGRAVIIWSGDTTDWSRPGVSRIVSRGLSGIHPGGIILMHDGGGPRAQTVAALPTIIGRLKAQGYRFATVSELLAMRHVSKPAPKKKKG